MKQGQKVGLNKVQSIVDHSKALPPGYEIVGTLAIDVKVGYPMVVARTHRPARAGETPDANGMVEANGIFRTTPVVGIKGNDIKTNNSIWRITNL